MKKGLYFFTLAAAFALALAPANAYFDDFLFGDVTANYDTGKNSYNYSYSGEDSSIVVDNYDSAEVGNEVYTYSNTGNNDADDNSGNVTIVTGDAASFSSVANNVNYIDTSIVDFSPCGCEDDWLLTGNVMTGKNSDNEAIAQRNDRIVVRNVKEAGVGNFVDTDSDTGNNDADDNGGYYYEEHSNNWYRNTRTTRYYYYRPYIVSEDRRGSSSYDEVSFPMGGDVTIVTGDAASASDVVNVVNTDITRVTRGSFDLAL